MKNSFSSAVNESLRGRSEGRTQAEKTEAFREEPVEEKKEKKTRVRETHKEKQETVTESKPAAPVRRAVSKKAGAPETADAMLKADGTPRKSKAGRKPKALSEKKVQLTLTLSRQCQEQLQAWADRKPRSAPNYLSEYVEEHLEEIMNYYSK